MTVCWVNFDAIVSFCCQLAFCFKYKRMVDLVINVFNWMQAVKQSQKVKFSAGCVVSVLFILGLQQRFEGSNITR